MFYISSVSDKLYGVTDTTDGVEEFYTRDQIYALIFKYKFKIEGVCRDNISVVNMSPKQAAIANIIEPLESAIKKVSFLSFPNEPTSLQTFEDIKVYMKAKYEHLLPFKVRFRYATDANYWYDMLLQEDGSLVIMSGNINSDNKRPQCWYPLDCETFSYGHTLNQWKGNKLYLKAIRKLIKSWDRIKDYYDNVKGEI